jgi:hypothetical protein
MIDAFVDKLDDVGMALHLGDLLGVDLANDPWNEAGAAAQANEHFAAPTFEGAPSEVRGQG